MKQRLKRFIASIMLIFPLILCGCANPFTTTNFVGNSDSDIDFTPEQESAGGVDNTGGNDGGTDEPTDPNAGMYYDPTNDDADTYPTITDSFRNTKLIYKPDATVNSAEIKNFLYNPSGLDIAEAFLTRAVSEYGVGQVDYATAISGVPSGTKTITPFNAVISDTLVRAGLITAAEQNQYNATTLEKLVYSIRNCKIYYKTVATGSETPFVLMCNDTYDLEVGLPLTISYNAGVYTLSCSNIRDMVLYKPYAAINNSGPLWQYVELTNTTCTITPGFYFVKVGTKTFILSFGQTFIDSLESNLMMVLDSHEDGVRYNVENVSAQAAKNGVTPYTVSYKSWTKTLDLNNTNSGNDLLRDYINTHTQQLSVDFASVLLFGLNETYGINFPDVEVSYGGYTGKVASFYSTASSNADRYLNFCATYIDHVGLTNYEVDMLAEFFLHNYIGDTVLALDQARFTHMTDNEVKEHEIKTFNSNEAVLNNSGTIVKFRQLIADYNNITTRAISKNNVFDSINYVTDDSGTTIPKDNTVSNQFIKYDTRHDSRSTMFKNYTNTIYASLNFVKATLGYEVDVNVEILNVYTDYLMNVSFNNDFDENGNIVVKEDEEEEEDSGDDEDLGDEGEGEGEEDLNSNKILDRDLCGKVQSIVFMPTQSVEVHYLELLVEPDLEALNYVGGEKIVVRPIMRYCTGGKVYTCTNLLINGAGEAELTAFYDSDDKCYTTDPVNVVYGSGDFFKFYDENGKLAADIKAITLGQFVDNEPTDVRYNQIFSANKVSAHDIGHFTVSPFANGKGVNYVYNDTSTDFLEISFLVSVDGSNFANNYGLGVSISDIYGKVL